MKTNPRFALAFALSLIFSAGLLASCSSDPVAPPLPEWAKGAARKVDGGYIVYVESAEDVDPEKAKFKAEAAGLEDIANECSFIPKEARVEDKFEVKNQYMHEAYVKVGIEMQVCDEARKATSPEQIQKLANVPMTEEVKRYQDILGKADVTDVDDADTGGAVVPPAGVPVAANQPATYGDTVHLYVVREQIWQYKEDVILAPPGTYVPGTPAYTKYDSFIRERQPMVAQIEAAHPDLRTAPHTWGAYRSPIIRRYGAVGRPRDTQNVVRKHSAAAPANSKNEKEQHEHRRRRRGDRDEGP